MKHFNIGILIVVSCIAITGSAEAAESGGVVGRIQGADSKEPLAGAAVILCPVTVEHTCLLTAALSTVAGEDGSFQMTDVPAGRYFSFYDRTGGAKENWEDSDQSELIINLQGLENRFRSEARTQLFATFGGGGGISESKGTVTRYKDGKLAGGDGSISSLALGLTLEFRELKPLQIEVVAGEEANLNIEAWGK